MTLRPHPRRALTALAALTIPVALALATACAGGPSGGAPPAGGDAAAPAPAPAGTPTAPTARAAPAAPPPVTAAPTLAPTATPIPTPTPDPRGNVLERRPPEVYSPQQVDGITPRLYPPGTSPPARFPVERHLIRFASTDVAGAPVEILAQLFVPRSDAPATRPVLVYGPGTTGLGDQCAPSREQPTVRTWGDYQAHMLSYAAQGYIAILPDYAGFNDEARLQAYFVADSEARVLLDAARAVYRFFGAAPGPVTPQRAVFFAGYSQGGHAAFAARDVAQSYAPDVPMAGVIGHGASTDVAALLRDSPYFAPYVLYSFADAYGPQAVDINRLFLPRWATTLPADVTTKCIDAMPTYYGNNAQALYQPAFREALFAGRLAETFPLLHEALERNSTGLVPSAVPALVLQGGTDPIVPVRSQGAFVARLCAAGGRVTYRTYPNVHHFQTRQVGFRDTLAWMQTLLDGGAPPTTCT